MKSVLFLLVITVLSHTGNGLLGIRKTSTSNNTEHIVHANVKIYSNLAEISQPLGRLPLEFSEDDWRDIRADSVTLVGTNVTILQQTITEKKKSLDNTQVHVRSPSSSNTETKFVRATLIDGKRNLVKLIDKDISKDPIYLTVQSDHIVYDSEPPQSKYYVNFTFDTTDEVQISYLRSNLNWKTTYLLKLFDETKTPVLISMAEIRNDGQSKVDIGHAELLGGDINLQMHSQPSWSHQAVANSPAMHDAQHRVYGSAPGMAPPTVARAEEIAGLYVFPINQPFSIDAKTSYIIPLSRPRVTVERYSSISKYFHNAAGSFTGKAQRSYRLSADQFLSRGNCILREYDRLVGETSLPNLAAKNKHEFSIGEDGDITYKENITMLTTRTYNETSRRGSFHTETHTESTYNVALTLKNFKKNRAVKVEYHQQVHGQSLELLPPHMNFTQDAMKIKYTITLAADEEKSVSYKFKLII